MLALLLQYYPDPFEFPNSSKCPTMVGVEVSDPDLAALVERLLNFLN